ncbi:hypothetical protein DL98DRAFT_569607 [Cadophora sp. DSE1049]|nr:hypothetical protein DL98DRAFT_569607 [Cadophora sp. DSE1049]
MPTVLIPPRISFVACPFDRPFLACDQRRVPSTAVTLSDFSPQSSSISFQLQGLGLLEPSKPISSPASLPHAISSQQHDATMTRRKRHAVEDPDQVDSSHESTRKYIKAEIEDETARGPSPSFPAVILSGFTWNMDVDARISRALEMYNPIFLEVSLELPAHDKLAIKNRFAIQTDFVKVVCASAEDEERMVNDLDHARFTWTNPYLEVRKLDVMGEGNGSRGKLPFKRTSTP